MSNINFFKQVKKRGMLSHLYLLTGDKLAKKEELAYLVSNLILEDYIKDSNLLETIKNNNNTQVFIINPEGSSIKKEQILSLQEEFSKTSLINAPRIYIINNVDYISLSAANSLLKFLEEPESNMVYGILTTSNIQKVLPTITSRSQIIRVESEIDSNIYDLLINEEVDSFVAKNLTYITNNINDALQLVDDLNIISIIKYVETYFNNYNNKNFNHLLEANELLGDFIFERKLYLMFLELMLKNYSLIYLEILKNKNNEYNINIIKNDISLIKKEIIKQNAYININLSLDVLMLKLKR